MKFLNQVGVGGRLAALVFLSIAGIFAMQLTSVHTFEDASLEIKEVELLHLTDVAMSVVKSYHAQAESGAMSTEEAQRSALSVIEGLRYEGENYFWVTDRQPVMLTHGANPALAGRDFAEFTDPNGVRLFQDMVDGTADGTAAVVAYQWAAPGAAEGDPPIDKVSIVQPFAPWGWIVGTGAYLTNIEAAQAGVNADLRNILIGLSIILLVGAALISASVTRPIHRLTDRMGALSEGDTESLVPYGKDRTVFGEISRALEVFRQSLIERASMQEQEEKRVAEERARERQADEERRAAEAKQQAAEQEAEEQRRSSEEKARAERETHLKTTQAEREARAAELASVVKALGVGLQNLADGKLSSRITEEFPADYEKLRTDFNAAVTALRDTVGAVMSNAESIRNETTEITAAADDLSTRTEKQAATLEETAAAMDELTTSVRSSSAGADEASDMSLEAQQKAEQGRDIASRAVEAMQSIQSSSKEISKITSVIEDIAFQTNLLALNAGVEAARANEAGRGFAVVATEVRALAQRSSDAAREINELLSSSSEQVKQGVDLVDKTGTALSSIVTSVSEISKRVSTIAESSREQSAGLNEINSAVNDLDHVTQRNAAMFEETTAASHALTQEVNSLVSAISQFQVDSGKSKAGRKEKPRQQSPRPQPEPAAQRHQPIVQGNTVLKGDAPEMSAERWEDF